MEVLRPSLAAHPALRPAPRWRQLLHDPRNPRRVGDAPLNSRRRPCRGWQVPWRLQDDRRRATHGVRPGLGLALPLPAAALAACARWQPPLPARRSQGLLRIVLSRDGEIHRGQVEAGRHARNLAAAIRSWHPGGLHRRTGGARPRRPRNGGTRRDVRPRLCRRLARLLHHAPQPREEEAHALQQRGPRKRPAHLWRRRWRAPRLMLLGAGAGRMTHRRSQDCLAPRRQPLKRLRQLREWMFRARRRSEVRRQRRIGVERPPQPWHALRGLGVRRPPRGGARGVGIPGLPRPRRIFFDLRRRGTLGARRRIPEVVAQLSIRTFGRRQPVQALRRTKIARPQRRGRGCDGRRPDLVGQRLRVAAASRRLVEVLLKRQCRGACDFPLALRGKLRCRSLVGVCAPCAVGESWRCKPKKR